MDSIPVSMMGWLAWRSCFSNGNRFFLVFFHLFNEIFASFQPPGCIHFYHVYARSIRVPWRRDAPSAYLRLHVWPTICVAGLIQPVQPRAAVLMQFKFRKEAACVFMVPCVHLARVYVLLYANDGKKIPCLSMMGWLAWRSFFSNGNRFFLVFFYLFIERFFASFQPPGCIHFYHVYARSVRVPWRRDAPSAYLRLHVWPTICVAGSIQPVQPRAAVLMPFKFREEAACIFMVPCVHLARVYVLLYANDGKKLPCFAISLLALNAHVEWDFFPFRTEMSQPRTRALFTPFTRDAFSLAVFIFLLSFGNWCFVTVTLIRHTHCVSTFHIVLYSLRTPPPLGTPISFRFTLYLHPPTFMEGGGAARSLYVLWLMWSYQS